MTQIRLIAVIAALAASSLPARAETTDPVEPETLCMAQALYYEARGEGVRGQEAVAEVILQRSRSSARPDTICGVVYEPYQFSFVTDGSTLQALDESAWKAAYHLAERVVKGELVTSLTRRAQFYHEVNARPAWAENMVRTAQIGNHVFYRLPPRTRSS